MENNKEFEITLPKINSLFDDVEHGILSPLSHLKEFDNHWILEFDLPLVSKKDIKITLDENMINVEAKLKNRYYEEKQGNVSEFEYFKKSISLPGKINNKKIIAKFQKGRLKIKMVKKITGNTVKIS